MADATKVTTGDDTTILESDGTEKLGAGSSDFSPDTSNSLDELLKQSEADAAEAAGDASVNVDPPVKETPSANDNVPAVKETTDEVVPVKETPAPSTPPADEFDAIALPPYTKPNTAKSFEQLKTAARTKLATVEAEREAFKKELEAAKSAAPVAPVAAEVEKELKELREFRQKMDVEADPSFKDFDAKIASNTEAIYSRMEAAGLDKSIIERVKALGGPGEVDWDKVAAKLPGNFRRFLDAKIVDNEDLIDKKKAAIEAAKKNSTEFLKSRESQITGTAAERQAKTEAQIAELTPKALPWMVKKTAAADATPEVKAEIERHNKLVADVSKDLADAKADDSPEMRAILVLSYGQFRRGQIDLAQERANSAALVDNHKKEIAAVNAKLAEVTGKLDKIKKSSTGRLTGGLAPTAERPAPKANYDQSTDDALDTLLAAAKASKE